MFDLIRSIQKRDPAHPGFFEVLLAYNGVHAMMWHRLNVFLYGIGLKAVARFFANIARILTGIEIHPGATIGRRLFIDHGTGVVIGQTAVIGNDVTLYHGVTLGGVGRSGDALEDKRHPTISDGAMIGSGAQILGNITIGKNTKIGSNSVVTIDIPDGCTALGIPARIICNDDKTPRAYGLPSRSEMESLSCLIEKLQEEIETLKRKK